MTNQRQHHPAFPLLGTIVGITVAAVACLVVVVGVAAYTAAWEMASTAGAAIGFVWLCSVIAVLPVAALGSMGVMATVWGYFIGAAVRFLACFALCAWLVLNVPGGGNAVVLCVVGTYVVLMFVEAGFVGRYLWAKDSLSDDGGTVSGTPFASRAGVPV